MTERMAMRERAEYYKARGWDWTVPASAPKEKPVSRKLFANVEDQLLKPTITVYRG